MHLTSPEIILPSIAGNPLLTFDHYVATELGFDGGNLKIRANGNGVYTVVARPTSLSTRTTPSMPVAGNTNPMAGEPAYTGTDGGEIFGTWGRTHVDLTSYAQPGDKIISVGTSEPTDAAATTAGTWTT